MLINEKLGTWFFLAEILTTLDLPPDQPTRDRCGTCERCIKVCPTRAITAPHNLDARRCISYLTIELKGPIPLELRPLIGDRVFGCDDCLDACPWNRFAQAGRETAFSARRSTTAFLLRDYFALNETEFRDLDKLDIVGIFPNYATAYAAWRAKAQQTVDNAHMRYFIVHLHRLLDPQAEHARP